MNILLIEPDLRLARTYKNALESTGHTVVIASHAQSAVHAIDAQVPDLIVLELQLAGHNGIEFMYEFRSYAEWKDIPVMLLTMVAPHALLITTEQYKQLGIVDVLYKPATHLKQLVRAVSEAI